MIAERQIPDEQVTITEVYDRLRSLARGLLAKEPAGHTLQATALVHEAVVRLAADRSTSTSAESLVAQAALAMRHVLVDYARRRKAIKRGGLARRTSLDDSLAQYERASFDIIALNDALDRLATIEPQAARVVDLRFFGRMTGDETAAALGVSRRTTERLWQFARLWLHSELRAEGVDVFR